MQFREIEKIIKADCWQLKSVRGSHSQYTHPIKPGKVTIPNHTGDLDPPNCQVHIETGGPLAARA